MAGPPLEKLRRVAAILDRLLELPAADRQAELERACGDSSERRRQVEIALRGEVVGFLARPSNHADSMLPSSMLGVAAAPQDDGEERDASSAQGPVLAGRYRLGRRCGAGGMGVVYEAQDLRLDRKVALKFLSAEWTRDPEVKRRFLREARAASRLQHPNICTVFEIGETEQRELFIALAFCEGRTLRALIDGRVIAVDDALRIAVCVAAALEAAHSTGVVHRDVKPGNIMVTESGDVKLLDFGLAHIPAQDLLTSNGRFLGTLAYMSPERLEGQEIDHRADLWSLGVTLYEMVTGRLPFVGQSGEPSISAILNGSARPASRLRPGLPPELDRVLAKALAKDPTKRQQTAGELRRELLAVAASPGGVAERARSPLLRRLSRRVSRRMAASLLGVVALATLTLAGDRLRRSVSSRPLETIDSLAVLPLDNLTRDPRQIYFADGMTEALIDQLGQIGSLERVISRTSVMSYRDRTLNLAEIASELGVEGIVEGSVLLLGKRVRVAVRLMQAQPERQLWSRTYDRDLSDVLMLHSEVARAIAREISASLKPAEEARLSRETRVDPRAYDLFLMGQQQLNQRSKEGTFEALDLLRRAIDADPTYAAPHASLAEGYALAVFDGVLEAEDGYRRARVAATRAVTLDDQLADGWTALMRVKVEHDWDWAGAEQAIERALALNPNSADARHHHAWYLATIGRPEAAVDEMRRAASLDPVSFTSSVGAMLYLAGRYDEAIRHAQGMLDRQSNAWSAYRLEARALVQLGRVEEGIAHLEAAVALAEAGTGSRKPLLGSLACAYALAGREADTRRLIEELAGSGEGDAYHMALIHTSLGDADAAFEWLHRALAQRSAELTRLGIEPRFQSLRSDPRFGELLRQMGLAAYFPQLSREVRPEASL